MLRRTLTLGLALAFLEAAAADLDLAEDRFSFRITPTYFSGDYGTGTQTNLMYLPFDFRWDYSRARLKVIVPYVSISNAGSVTFTGSGPGAAVPSPEQSSSGPSPVDPGGVPAGTPTGVLPAASPAPSAVGGPPVVPPGLIRTENVGTTQSGLGDVRLAADLYLLKGSAARPWITFEPFYKLATADESKGLGTGESDYGAGLGLTAPLGRGWQAYADAAYQVTGDPPGIDYRNVRRLGFGLGKTLKERLTWQGYYEERNSLLQGVANLRDVSVGLQVGATAGTTLGFTLFKGLSDSAEDWGLSLNLAR